MSPKTKPKRKRKTKREPKPKPPPERFEVVVKLVSDTSAPVRGEEPPAPPPRPVSTEPRVVRGPRPYRSVVFEQKKGSTPPKRPTRSPTTGQPKKKRGG